MFLFNSINIQRTHKHTLTKLVSAQHISALDPASSSFKSQLSASLAAASLKAKTQELAPGSRHTDTRYIYHKITAIIQLSLDCSKHKSTQTLLEQLFTQKYCNTLSTLTRALLNQRDQ